MSCRKRPLSPHVKDYCHTKKTFHSGHTDNAHLSNGLSKYESTVNAEGDCFTASETSSNSEIAKNEKNRLLEKKKYLKMLQKQLRCEEAKLIILKKLRSSQLLLFSQQHQQQSNVRTVETKAVNDANTKQQLYSHPMTKNKQIPQRQNHVQRRSPSNLQNHNKTHSQNYHTSLGVSTFNSQTSRPQQTQHYRSNSHMQRAPPVETVEQRYAAAKMHLRRNLEKMLLSLPLPKTPQVDFTFIPSLASMEFQMLLGLEETVRFLKDGLHKRIVTTTEKVSVPPAYVCAQCNTSCSPLWRSIPDTSEVICEKCAKHNQKKVLKAEHASKLRNAFAKAAQQEKEFEHKFQSESMNFALNNVPNMQNVSASSITSQPAYFPLTSDHLKFYQTQILRSSTFPGLLPGVTLPFMTSSIAAALSGKNSENSAQFLLDMIPSASNSVSSNNARSAENYKKCSS